MASATGKVVTVLGKHFSRAALTRFVGEDGAELTQFAGSEWAKGGFSALADLGDVASANLANGLVKQFEDSRLTIKQFKQALEDLIKGDARKQPLFVLIDELDRCRPTHAVAMLERIKHLFDVDGLVFVLATDTDQLRHAINAIYGATFDSRGYLLRFFDRTYRFPEPDRLAYVGHLFKQHSIDTTKLRSPPDDKDHVKFFTQVVDTFDLPLREIERCCDMLETVITLWNKPFRIQMPYMLPLIVAAMKPDPEFFRALSTSSLLSESFQDRFPRSVSVQFSGLSEWGEPKGQETSPLKQLLTTILGHRTATVPRITAQHDGDPRSDWVKDCFREEFSKGNGNSFHGAGPKSFITRYPDLVGQVGRLAPET